MASRAGVITGIIVILCIGGAGMFVALSDDVYPMSEQLAREDSLDEEIRNNRSSILLQFGDEEQDVTLASEVDIRERSDDMYDVRILTSHSDGADTHLDSLRVRLFPGEQTMPEVALRTPGGHPWEPIHFQQTSDGQAVLVDVPDLGFQGTGTVPIEFLVGPYPSGEVPDQMTIDFNARLHENRLLQLTDYEADALVEVPMPDAEPDEQG